MSGGQDEVQRQQEATCPECGHPVAEHMNTNGCRVPLYRHEDSGLFDGGIVRCTCQWLPPDNPMTEGPAMAYMATGGEHWQHGGGWGYRPVNAAAMAMHLRGLATKMQDAANALAALGMGKGRYPEWTDEMASLARRMAVWAGEIGNETANYSALPKSSLAPCGVVD